MTRERERFTRCNEHVNNVNKSHPNCRHQRTVVTMATAGESARDGEGEGDSARERAIVRT